MSASVGLETYIENCKVVEDVFGEIPQVAESLRGQIFDYYLMHRFVNLAKWEFLPAGLGVDIYPLTCLACNDPIEDTDSSIWHCRNHDSDVFTKREQLMRAGEQLGIDTSVEKSIDNVMYTVIKIQKQKYDEDSKRARETYKAQRLANRKNGISTSDRNSSGLFSSDDES